MVGPDGDAEAAVRALAWVTAGATAVGLVVVWARQHGRPLFPRSTTQRFHRSEAGRDRGAGSMVEMSLEVNNREPLLDQKDRVDCSPQIGRA